MRSLTLRLFAVLALAGSAISANATSVDLGVIGPGDLIGSSFTYSAGTTFDDEWTFTLDQDLLTSISVESNQLIPVFSITDFDVSSSDISFTFDPADTSFGFIGPLLAGTYTFDVSGTVDGLLGGQYQVIIGTVIPLPASIYLLCGSVLALFATGRRRA
jgi:hypothetical protein